MNFEHLENREMMHGGDAIHSTGHDNIPIFGNDATTETVQAGNWNDPSIWSNGVPDSEDNVKINHDVTIDKVNPKSDFNKDGIVDRADLIHWATHYDLDDEGDANGDNVTNLSDFLIWQQELGQTAKPAEGISKDILIGSEGSLSLKEEGVLKAKTIMTFGDFSSDGGTVVFRDIPLDLINDPNQFGNGLIVVQDGSLQARAAHFTSENPEGTRGHILAAERAWVDIQDSVFSDLGRTTMAKLDSTSGTHIGTNQIGRYTLHLHHLYGPQGLDENTPQFIVKNNTFEDGKKWAIALHDSHYGLVEGNKITNFEGSGIVFEDGSEYGNLVKNNIIDHILGSGEGVQSRGDGLVDTGHEGAGIWGRGVSNNVIDNTVLNSPFGVVIWSRFQPRDVIPAFKGADTKVNFVEVDHGQQLGHEWSGQTVINCNVGASLQGLDEETNGKFVAKDWVFSKVKTGIDASYSNNLRFEDGNFQCSSSFASELGFVGRIEIINSHVVSPVGVKIMTDGYVENSTFVGKVGVLVEYERTSTAERTIVLNGVTGNIAHKLGDWFNKRSYTSPLNVLVYNYNGVEGDNFQLWMDQQRPNYVMPEVESNRGRRMNPEPGLTNQQLWDKYKMTFAGRILPANATTRPGITGWVTPILEDLEIPQMTGLQVLNVTDNSVTIKVTSNEPTWAQLEYNAGDITIEKYTNMLPATTELSTEHTITITGLKPGTKYQYLVRLVDASGNLGGHVQLGGLRYITQTFKTKATV